MRLPAALHRAVPAALVAALAAGGCANQPSKEEQEAAKNTFTCVIQGERLVVRFDSGEARILMPGGERIVLYQLPAASGVRYSNGTLELRGKGTDLRLESDGRATPLTDCKPYELPKPG